LAVKKSNTGPRWAIVENTRYTSSMDIEARTLEEVLRDLDGALRDLYVERYRGLVLYGSQARGEADEGSDVDLLLLLEEPVEVGKEIRRSSGVVAPLALEASLALSLIPVGIEEYRASLDPYLINARAEGALVSPG
jgi:predicted nucleotidyltransferase